MKGKRGGSAVFLKAKLERLANMLSLRWASHVFGQNPAPAVAYRQAYVAHQHAMLRKDTRAQHTTAAVLSQALHARLRAGV